jgi:hypothetical protein
LIIAGCSPQKPAAEPQIPPPATAVEVKPVAKPPVKVEVTRSEAQEAELREKVKSQLEKNLEIAKEKNRLAAEKHRDAIQRPRPANPSKPL